MTFSFGGSALQGFGFWLDRLGPRLAQTACACL
jgi:hypothetical protein